MRLIAPKLTMMIQWIPIETRFCRILRCTTCAYTRVHWSHSQQSLLTLFLAPSNEITFLSCGLPSVIGRTDKSCIKLTLREASFPPNWDWRSWRVQVEPRIINLFYLYHTAHVFSLATRNTYSLVRLFFFNFSRTQVKKRDTNENSLRRIFYFTMYRKMYELDVNCLSMTNFKLNL